MSIAPSLLFQKNPLPTRKVEDWKYADISFLQKENYSAFSLTRDNECEYIAAEKKIVVRLFNCSSSAAVRTIGSEMPKGFQLFTAKEFLKTKDASSLSTFSHYQNYLLELKDVLQSLNLYAVVTNQFPVDVTIQLEIGAYLPATSERKIVPSFLGFVFQPGSSATILEKIHLPENYFVLSGVDYFLGKDSAVRLLKLESGSTAGRGGHTSRLHIEASAQAHMTTLNLNSGWSRHNIFVELAGEQAHVGLEAAYLAGQQQFVDHHSEIDHCVGHTTSVQKYNGVLTDKARGVFNGKVRILKDAQKSSAVQLNRNLLLSKTAEINSKPELLIDADDVQAKHGATVGQLNPDQLFYLVSRGIPENTARAMLTRGFIEEIGLSLPPFLQKIFFSEVSTFVHDNQME